MNARPLPASTLASTTLLIGVDDTDNLDSRGTGFLVQILLARCETEGLGTALGATRHQLLVDPRIPYTSHNSSACIAWNGGPEPDVEGIIASCGRFLERESAPGSDPGLAVATSEVWAAPAACDDLVDFGRRAKREVLDQESARRLAGKVGVHLSGHGGDSGGVIGALAAVGLHLSGADGLFLWMPGIRSLEGEATYRQLRCMVPIDVARDLAGHEPEPDDLIELGDWVRPVLAGGRAVLLLEPPTAGGPSSDAPPGVLPPRWEVAPREVVKRH